MVQLLLPPCGTDEVLMARTCQSGHMRQPSNDMMLVKGWLTMPAIAAMVEGTLDRMVQAIPKPYLSHATASRSHRGKKSKFTYRMGLVKCVHVNFLCISSVNAPDP